MKAHGRRLEGKNEPFINQTCFRDWAGKNGLTGLSKKRFKNWGGNVKRIIRVFPHRIKNTTPMDELAVVGRRPELFDEADEVHVSVTFTWDLPAAEKLCEAWKTVAPVKIGGPATGMKGENFQPGMYLKDGYTITSRGCPNRCWFCSVWKREGNIRELPVSAGWNLLDDNILACSDSHIARVFDMLRVARKQYGRTVEFTGGLEAKRLNMWHARSLKDLHPKQLFFAYDTEDDLEPLQNAGKMLLDAGFTRASHSLRCYVLCGYPKDTIAYAEMRMKETINAGFTPMAMAWRDEKGTLSKEWAEFQRQWARPAIVYHNPSGVQEIGVVNE